ncbi:MAG: hypothetical protein FJ292_10010 [Planctomycetes bacterium]|nr:hypothetical protein [Planctomycetota bacterium]
MNQQASPDAAEFQMDQGLSLVDVWQFVQRHFVRIMVWVVLGCMFYSGVIVLLRSYLPRASVARQTIQFTFDGAERGEYPNGMPFSPKDVLAAPVLDQAYSALQLSGYLKPEDFASRLTIFQGSRDMEMLQLEYQQKLSNTKLLQPERESLERDFKAKMDALRGRVYTVAFDASELPIANATAERIVSKVPEVWANFAQATRGVKDYDIPVVTTAALAGDDSSDYLNRAETLRSTSRRLLDSVRKLEVIPGSNLVRDKTGGSLGDLREDIQNNYRVSVLPSYLNHLRIAYENQPERVRDVISIRVSNQERLQKLATAKAEEFGSAFREYITLNSGAVSPSASGGVAVTQPGMGQALGLGSQMPAIMSLSEGFFDRVIAQGIMSRDVEYRQKLNERQLEAAVAVLEGQESLDFDKWILEQLSTPGSKASLPAEQVQKEAGTAIARLRDFAGRVQEIHRLLSERNLNAAAQLYRNEDPVIVSSEAAVTTSRMMLGLVATALVMFVLGAVSGLSADRKARLAS